MRVALLDRYNKNGQNLSIADVPVPEVGSHDVLVKIAAAGVNPLDNMIIRGEVKLIVSYRMPLIMGNEFVGRVEKIGSQVKGFAVGDRVYGRMPLGRIGAFAEYAAVDSSAIALVPDYMSDIEAASVPLTALTALQALDLLKAKHGDTLFISGGTGSFGVMAIPIAKGFGLNVVTNGNGQNRDRVLSLGADKFFDYKVEDYAHSLKNIDCVIDTLGDRELPKEFSILKIGGRLVSLRGLPNGEFASRTGLPLYKRLLFSVAGLKYDKMASRHGQRYFFIFVHEDGKGLQTASNILAAKQVKPSVDAVFSLDDVNQALRKVAAGGSNGKTVLKIS